MWLELATVLKFSSECLCDWPYILIYGQCQSLKFIPFMLGPGPNGTLFIHEFGLTWDRLAGFARGQRLSRILKYHLGKREE